MMNRTVDVWFADCEVFYSDVIWVFKNKRTGERKIFHNDSYGIEAFINNNPDMWICGYNFRDYDQYILKGTLLHWDNQQMKNLNDTLIFEELTDVWELLGQEAWDITVPPIIDLFHDIVPRKSLKEIEANMGMNIRETEISFDIERALTEDELASTIEYCVHDVDATEALYYKRLEYLKTKKTLCEEANLDDALMMKNTNARVVAEALRAEAINPIRTFGVEWYKDVMPDMINLSKMPYEVCQFVNSINTFSGWRDEVDNILFDFHGTPTVMGIGGIHASTGYIEEHILKSGPRKGQTDMVYHSTPKTFVSDDEYVIIMQDVGSFYPSMMILYDYLSRAVPPEERHIFKDFYDMRMKAKANGDKERANAAKLVLNTVYGCMKNQYNKLYDPFMATCVCLSGQLFILELMNRIFEQVDNVEIVQLNTDGYVLKVPIDSKYLIDRVTMEWCRETGFTLETDVINRMVQRDVNNYVIEFDNGTIKAKGGTVKNWKGGDFKSNSATIIDKAIVNYLLNDVPISDTIRDTDDLEAYQIVLKAGSDYKYCIRQKTIQDDSKMFGVHPIIETTTNKVHRVFAVKDGWTYYKEKEGGNPARFPDSPDNCLEDYEIKSIDNIDKLWYNMLAQKKLDAFLGK